MLAKSIFEGFAPRTASMLDLAKLNRRREAVEERLKKLEPRPESFEIAALARMRWN
jgi:hypothetical protein